MRTAGCFLTAPDRAIRGGWQQFGAVYLILHHFLLLLEVTRTRNLFLDHVRVAERMFLLVNTRVFLSALLFNHHRFIVNDWIYFGPVNAVALRQCPGDRET